jgi:hypothetical protein
MSSRFSHRFSQKENENEDILILNRMSLEEDFFCPRMSHSLQRQLVNATFQIIRTNDRPCQKVLSVKLILKKSFIYLHIMNSNKNREHSSALT